MKTILHLDSGKFFKEIVKMIVSERGFDVITTDNGEDALNILENNEISLIITGNELLDMKGEDFIVKINESVYSSIPVIMLTSTESVTLRKRLFSLGIVDYILKKNMNKSRLEGYFDNLMIQDILLKKIQEEKIAVLDDDITSLRVIKNIFKLNNINNVDYFDDPEKFLKSLHKYDFFLIDLVLPHVSGEDLIIKIRKERKNSLILVVSGINNTKTISHSMMYGADDYITKPFDNSLLMLRLKANARTFFLYKEVEKQAVSDSLTGLFNHEYICSNIDKHIKEYNENKIPFCIVMFDIDYFKKINDKYGHLIGDEVLKLFSKDLKKYFENDICGRYGGEEFLVILPDTDKSEGLRKVKNFNYYIRKKEYAKCKISLTVSGGLVEYKGGTSDELIYLADNLLYVAKNNGRDNIVECSETVIQN